MGVLVGRRRVHDANGGLLVVTGRARSGPVSMEREVVAMASRPKSRKVKTEQGRDAVGGAPHRRGRAGRTAAAEAADGPPPDAAERPEPPDLDRRDRRQSARRKAAGPERTRRATGAPIVPTTTPPTDPC